MRDFDFFAELRQVHKVAAEPVDMFKNCPDYTLNKYQVTYLKLHAATAFEKLDVPSQESGCSETQPFYKAF